LIDIEPEAVPPARLRAAETTGRPLGSEDFVTRLEDLMRRRLRRRKPGRKAKVPESTSDLFAGMSGRTNNATTTAAVKMKFAADKTVDASKINVDTKDNLVTLTGTVKSKVAADKAVALAKSVEGVKGVTPQLTIKSQ
jgi:hypothetical protein